MRVDWLKEKAAYRETEKGGFGDGGDGGGVGGGEGPGLGDGGEGEDGGGDGGVGGGVGDGGRGGEGGLGGLFKFEQFLGRSTLEVEYRSTTPLEGMAERVLRLEPQ